MHSNASSRTEQAQEILYNIGKNKQKQIPTIRATYKQTMNKFAAKSP